MSVQQNKAVVRRLIEELNEGNLAIADELIAPTYVDHNASPMPSGSASFKETIALFRAGFPDLRWTIEELVGEDDRVVMRVIARGTHQGSFFGVAPTGKSVTVNGIAIYRLEGGRIAEAWVLRDVISMMQQIGALPIPA